MCDEEEKKRRKFAAAILGFRVLVHGPTHGILGGGPTIPSIGGTPPALPNLGVHEFFCL